MYTYLNYSDNDGLWREDLPKTKLFEFVEVQLVIGGESMEERILVQNSDPDLSVNNFVIFGGRPIDFKPRFEIDVTGQIVPLSGVIVSVCS